MCQNFLGGFAPQTPHTSKFISLDQNTSIPNINHVLFTFYQQYCAIYYSTGVGTFFFGDFLNVFLGYLLTETSYGYDFLFFVQSITFRSFYIPTSWSHDAQKIFYSTLNFKKQAKNSTFCPKCAIIPLQLYVK